MERSLFIFRLATLGCAISVLSACSTDIEDIRGDWMNYAPQVADAGKSTPPACGPFRRSQGYC